MENRSRIPDIFLSLLVAGDCFAALATTAKSEQKFPSIHVLMRSDIDHNDTLLVDDNLHGNAVADGD